MTDIIVEGEKVEEIPLKEEIPTETHEEMGDVRETIGRHEERLDHHDEKLSEHEEKHARHVALFDEMKMQRQFDNEDRERLWTAHRELMDAVESLKPEEVEAEIIAPPIETVTVEEKEEPEGTDTKKGRLRLFGGRK